MHLGCIVICDDGGCAAPDDDQEHGPQELRPQAPDQAHRPLEVLQADGVTHVDQIFSLEIVIFYILTGRERHMEEIMTLVLE